MAVKKMTYEEQELALAEARAVIAEMLNCQNNDCKCREGYGVCVQCKELARQFQEKYPM